MTGPDLEHCRQKLGLTQEQLAELLGVSVRTIQRHENAPHVPQAIAWGLLELRHREKDRERISTENG